LLGGGSRVVVVLLADGVGGHQRLVALGLVLCLRLRGFRTRQLRLCAVERCLVLRRIDLEQLLAGLHVAAFNVRALEHDARDPRAHLGHTRGFQAARQLAGQAHRMWLHSHNADCGRRHAGAARPLCLLVAAGCKCHHRECGGSELVITAGVRHR